MDGFLVVHVSHERTEVRVLADDDGGLGGVDERCGEFTGLIDTKSRGEKFTLLLSERLELLGRA